MVAVRQADLQDAEEIARVINVAFEVERVMRPDGRERTSPPEVRDIMQRATFFVAEQNAEIVGAVYVKVNGVTGYLGMLAVDPALHHSGIGRALREYGEDHCRKHGCTEMTLRTGDFRTELIPYYQRAGYRIVRTEPNPPDWPSIKPFTVVHMAKAL